MKTIYSTLKESGCIKVLKDRFQLEVEESYERGTSSQQLMSSLITLVPLKNSSLFKPGTKIYFTVGNYNKVLESVLLQLYSTLSPQFKCVAAVLKKWINDLNEKKLPIKPKVQYRWISLIFMLIFYMQQKKMLPLLDEHELT